MPLVQLTASVLFFTAEIWIPSAQGWTTTKDMELQEKRED